VYSNHCRISEQPTFINLLHKESGFFILKKISLKKEGNEQKKSLKIKTTKGLVAGSSRNFKQTL
jgi:hypothetical protein